jgi:2-oxoisovalerate dehydrogenase E1 component
LGLRRIALANKLKKNGKITAVFTGRCDIRRRLHEALNIAAVWEWCCLSSRIMVTDSTSTNEQYRCENLADKGKGYGMESYRME